MNQSDRIRMCDEPFNGIQVEQYKQRITFKPEGLWFGFGTFWIDWVKDEMPEWIKDGIYKLTIDTSKILVVDSLSDFHKKYNVKLYGHAIGINWLRIANEFSGIEIPSYQRDFRLASDYLWYYGWDVASGCIWDKSALIGWEKVPK